MTKNKEYKDFEKSRKNLQTSGYGETPIIPRIQQPSTNPYYGGGGNQKAGYDNPGMAMSPTSGYQVGSQGMQGAPFSYSHTNPPPGYYAAPPVSSVSYIDSGKVQSPYNPSAENAVEVDNGPVKKRKCRDIICLTLFAAFLALMAGVAIFAFSTGNLKRYDPQGNEECKVLRKSKESNEESSIADSIDGSFEDLADTLEKSWPYIVYMCLIALGISIVMTILLRLFAGIIIWTAVAIITLLLIGATVAVWIWYTKSDGGEKTGSLIVAIVVTIISTIYLILLISMRKRIAIVVQLFKEAGKAVHAIPLILLQPVWTFIATSLVSSIFVFLMVMLETSRDKDCKKPSFATYGRYLNIFAYLWMVQFCIGCQHLVVAGAVAQWYFTRIKSELAFPLLSSFKNLVRYHLGSVAFGSLIIAILKFIRYILEQTKKRLAGSNIFLRALICCCQCFFWCLDKVIQFINRNAYIEIAIYGKAFCPSAKRAFKMILNNALILAAINSIGDFVLFLSKLAIVALSGVCGYFIIKAGVKDDEKMDAEYAILGIGIVFSYFIAHCCLSIFEMCIDTIFVCFCEDVEMNDGSPSRPYFMSKGFMDFMKKNDKSKKKNRKAS